MPTPKNFYRRRKQPEDADEKKKGKSPGDASIALFCAWLSYVRARHD